MNAVQGSDHVPLAVDRNGELHDSQDIESTPASLAAPLRCADCGAALEAVRAHPRRDGATIVHVAAHYRLAPGATHALSCPWPTPQPAPAPVARRSRRPQPDPPVYSLMVPGRRPPTPVWRQRVFRPAMRPALNSAAQVADLLTRHGDPSHEVRLYYGGRPVSWHDFLFTCTDSTRLADYLRPQQPTHPIAVVGRLGRRQMARSGASHYWALYDLGAATGSQPGAARVLLRSSHRQLLNAETVAQPVVALGWWQLRTSETAAKLDVIALWVDRRWQIGPCPAETLVERDPKAAKE